MPPDKLPADLRALAREMHRIADEMMRRWDVPTRTHGKELHGAAQIAESWADAIAKEDGT